MTVRMRHLYRKNKQISIFLKEYREAKTQSSPPFYKFSVPLCLCVEKISYLCTKDKQYTYFK